MLFRSLCYYMLCSRPECRDTRLAWCGERGVSPCRVSRVVAQWDARPNLPKWGKAEGWRQRPKINIKITKIMLSPGTITVSWLAAVSGFGCAAATHNARRAGRRRPRKETNAVTGTAFSHCGRDRRGSAASHVHPPRGRGALTSMGRALTSGEAGEALSAFGGRREVASRERLGRQARHEARRGARRATTRGAVGYEYGLTSKGSALHLRRRRCEFCSANGRRGGPVAGGQWIVEQ